MPVSIDDGTDGCLGAGRGLDHKMASGRGEAGQGNLGMPLVDW